MQEHTHLRHNWVGGTGPRTQTCPRTKNHCGYKIVRRQILHNQRTNQCPTRGRTRTCPCVFLHGQHLVHINIWRTDIKVSTANDFAGHAVVRRRNFTFNGPIVVRIWPSTADKNMSADANVNGQNLVHSILTCGQKIVRIFF